MSGGGGGSHGSGAVEYPQYMEDQHETWLTAINTALGAVSNPFSSAAAYDPSDLLDDIDAEIADYKNDLEAIDAQTSWTDAVEDAWDKLSSIANGQVVADDISAFSDILDEELANRTLPRFQIGMASINAVHSSAFVIGSAMIESAKARDVAKYGTEIKMKNHLYRIDGSVRGAETILRTVMMQYEFRKSVATIVADTKRIRILAEKEQVDQDLNIDEHNATWELSKYTYGANMMGAIAGSAVPTGKSPSTLQSGLSGAMSGAAMGMMTGNPLWAAGGAIAGGLAGILSN